MTLHGFLAIDKLADAIGAKELSTLASLQGPTLIAQILKALKASSIEIPKVKTEKSGQAAFGAKKKREMLLPDPANYTLVPGSLCNSDGSPACVTQDFCTQASGYMPITPAAAVPWLRTDGHLSSDELALLVFGSLTVETKLQSCKATLPFYDQDGQKVLIACALVQFGDRQITPAELDAHRIAQDNGTLVSLTLWKQDWDEAAWKLAVQNPFRFIRNLPGAQEAIASLWGKSFRKGRAVTTPHDANSVQLHAFLHAKIGVWQTSCDVETVVAPGREGHPPGQYLGFQTARALRTGSLTEQACHQNLDLKVP